MEIRFAMNLLLKKRFPRFLKRTKNKPSMKEAERFAKMQHIKYVNLVNAKSCKGEGSKIRTFDGETLNPISDEHFSPFIANTPLLQDWPKFARDQGFRFKAAENFWPQIRRLRIHLERKQWALFDKQFRKLELNLPISSEAERVKATFKATELIAAFFTPFTDAVKKLIQDRIALADSASPTLTDALVKFFQAKQKDSSVIHELSTIRERWSGLYAAVAPIYTCLYWDDKKHTLDDFTLAQKRFEELKPFYVDCFETFCRISVIAAGIEGIIVSKAVGVPAAKRLIPIDEFDIMKNGIKPDVLKSLTIGDVFVPYIDHNLRNGCGHHSAHYDASNDSIRYVTENPKALKNHQMSYIRFCEKVVRLYAQLEVVSLYAHWLRQRVLGVPSSCVYPGKASDISPVPLHEKKAAAP